MIKLLKASILVFGFCFGVFAQTNEISTCPTVSIIGPAGITGQPNELINFSATVDNKGKDLAVEYVWSASNGKIIEGQGTQNIKIEMPLNGSLTATVKVKGFPADCPNTAAESLTYDPAPQAEKIDEFSEPFVKIKKNRVNEIVRIVNNDPTGQLYIIFRHKEKTLPKKMNLKEKNISNLLIQNGIEPERITRIGIFGQTESVEFWFVPAGATPPKIKDN